jgi:Cu(I)/Ag(I) efflux system membrane fusion protein
MKTKINFNKRDYKIIGITLFVGLFFGWLFFHGSGNKTVSGKATEEQAQEKKTIWTCSMHTQIRMDHPGKCPICGMDLIPLQENNGSETAISPDEIQMTDAATKIADIQTMIVPKAYPYKEVFLLGKVKPDERNISELTARFGGRIEKLYVNFTGQNVSKGEKLVTIYSPALVTAQKELLEAQEYKQSNPEFYKAARNKLKLWDLTEEQINNIEQKGEAQSYFDVLSPITGTVTMRNVALGDYVKEGSALFQVIDLTRVWIMFEAYESDLPWIKLGDKVDFTIESLPGKNFNGHVSFIDPLIDPKTRIAQVRVEVRNPGLVLKPEMFANGMVTSSIAGNQKDLMIPKTSVLWTGKRAVVYVKVPDREQPTFKYREIVLGPSAGEFYVVKAGLSEGEEIAVNGVFKIDASAQLAGKPSMMNQTDDMASNNNNHNEMGMISKNHNGHSGQNNRKSGTNIKPARMDMSANLEHDIFRVSGNCEMCKNRIETATKSIDGVDNASWNIDTKQLYVSFNKEKTNLNAIHKAIAHAGHDTEKETAPQEAYDKLPECCKYRIK